jgi:hypothetical protein
MNNNNNKNFALDTSIYFGTTLFAEDTLYNVQSVNLPGVDFSHPQIASRSGALITGQADNITFNDLQLTLIIDEGFNIWKDIMTNAFKMVKVTQPMFNKNFHDAYVVITDSQGNDILKVWFRNAQITSIGDLSFASSNMNEHLTLDVGLKYDYMEIQDDNYLISINGIAVVKADAVETNGKTTGGIVTSIVE